MEGIRNSMWEKIKKILSKGGDKCIVMENGESYVILKWENYEHIIDTCSLEAKEANESVDTWKAEEDAKTEPEVAPIEEEKNEKSEVKIEDLPF